MKKNLQSKTLKMAGKLLTLMGFSLVFAACYAPAPFEPEPVIDDNLYYHTEEPQAQSDAAPDADLPTDPQAEVLL